MPLKVESELQDIAGQGRKWFVNFSARKTLLISFDWCKTSDAIDMEIYGSALEEKSSFKMLGLPFSFRLDQGSFIPETASKKIGALIVSMKYLSSEVALISIILPFELNGILLPCPSLCSQWRCWVLSQKNCWSFTCCLS